MALKNASTFSRYVVKTDSLNYLKRFVNDTQMNLQISPAELAEKFRAAERPHLLDVREQEEHDFVALAGSTLIPLNELGARIDEISDWREKEIVVYCHHGIRSLNAIAQLRHFGFTNLRNLAGGIDRWTTDIDSSLPRY